jgi:hypothetical protein
MQYFSVTQEDIHGTYKSTVNGLDAWASMAIAGRGILIDYEEWAKENGIEYEPLSAYPIPLEHIKTIIAEKNLALVPGDIFILRTGACFHAMAYCTARKN